MIRGSIRCEHFVHDLPLLFRNPLAIGEKVQLGVAPAAVTIVCPMVPPFVVFDGFLLQFGECRIVFGCVGRLTPRNKR
jgi:hypothetical protein